MHFLVYKVGQEIFAALQDIFITRYVIGFADPMGSLKILTSTNNNQKHCGLIVNHPDAFILHS